jgi:nucleotide-binding universal stress UspA family protein
MNWQTVFKETTMYNKILVPLDGSKLAEAILPHVEDLAQHYKATVILMSVVEWEPLIIAPEPLYAGFDPQERERRFKEVETYLAGQQGEFRQKGIETKIILGEGPVAQTIIGVAEKEGVDLIAMASHGRTGLARVFYGSVAAGVLHKVDRPLLLIRSLENK